MKMKKKLSPQLSLAIAMSIMCMLPSNTFAENVATTTIKTGGTYDSLDINLDASTNQDNSGIEYNNSAASNAPLTIVNGGTINVSAKGNAYGIWGTDTTKMPSFITVNGKELDITAVNGETSTSSSSNPGGYGAIGIWSSTTWNPIGTGDQEQPTYQGGKVTLNNDVTNIKLDAKRNGLGLLAGSAFGNNSNGGGYIAVNGKLNIDITGHRFVKNTTSAAKSNRSVGITAYTGRVDLNDDTNITVKSDAFNNNKYPSYSEVAGILAGESGYINSAANKKLNINVIGNASGYSDNVFGICLGHYDLNLADKNHPDIIKDRASTINLNGETNILLNAQHSYGVKTYIYSKLNANTLIINFDNENADTKRTQYGLVAHDSSTINVNNLFIANDKETFTNLNQITALATGFTTSSIRSSTGTVWISHSPKININTNETGTVQINGLIENQDNGTIDLRLTNPNSYLYSGILTDESYYGEPLATTNLTLKNGATWKNYSEYGWNDSTLTNLVLDNKALLDMTYNEYSSEENFQNITIYNNMSGTNATVNMDIDASTNVNNSDRLYIAGTHTGEHHITLNNINKEGITDNAEGTILVSVNDEQGKFIANDHEGSLYWDIYTLDKEASETDGYNTDWYLKEVQHLPVGPGARTTTSVDSIESSSAATYFAWHEDDKLMQRMGDLRHNGKDEKGAWFRVKRGKTSYNNAGYFSNKSTMYQLGYDEITKQTPQKICYQGIAVDYTKGNISYHHGSGTTRAKAIAFYDTEMHSKGHYLDMVFKIHDIDNDFSVYDTTGKHITGSFDNQGISFSTEYGRKKILDANGWYIEPQGQLTLAYLGDANYTTSNNIDVHQDSITSVLGRIGFNFGRDINSKTNFYVKGNLLHEFSGNYTEHLNEGSSNISISHNSHDTWLEYGLGIAYQTGKNNHIYFDIERSSNSDFQKDWHWNVGARWTF